MSRKTKTTATKEEARPALVPKLRFPEFRGAEGWTQSVLATACDMQAGKFVSASNISESSEEGLFPCYGGNGLRGYTATHTHDGTYSLIGRQGALCGNVRLVNGQFHATEHAVVTSPKEAIDVGWLYYSLNLLNLNRFATGQAQPGLSVDVLKNVSLAIPPQATEQQKIAECLSSVDELMAALARKVAALKTHKKGLMQQLFPREGETLPRLRFPEFENAGEWVQKPIGDVSEVLMCKRIFAEETNPIEGVPFYKIGTLGGVPDAFISREKFEDYKSRYNYPRKGEVLITCSGSVGKCLPFDGKDAYFQDSNIVWLDNPTCEVRNEFLLMLLSNVNWGRLNSTTITRIYGPDLRGLAIKYPEDESEQQRIASCLSSLDALITAETQKLAALKVHKKGLMQQLFPAPEEVEA